VTEPQPGDRIAGYVVERKIGRGGMGVVFLARDERLGRPVALKLIVAAFADDEELRARFAREARIAASFEHAHVVPVYDVQEHEGALVIAMRYIEARDVGVALREQGPFAPERVADLLRQVCSALDAAHDRGLVHRDIKPGNVLLSGHAPDEHAYLTDFGLARDVHSEPGLTKSGHWVGSMDHIPPEQIEGGPIDRRTDVYAVACLAFQMLTGRAAFPGGFDEKLEGHLHGERPLVSALRPGLSEEVDRVIVRGMARAPDERPATTGALARELGEALARARELRTQETAFAQDVRTEEPAEPTPAPAPPPPPRRRRPVALAAAAGVALVAVVAVALALALGGGGGGGGGGGDDAGDSGGGGEATAPALDMAEATEQANAACQEIGNDQDNPYFCSGVANTRAEAGGTYVSDLALNDPEDGERCTARVRTSAAGGRVTRAVEQGTCMVQP